MQIEAVDLADRQAVMELLQLQREAYAREAVLLQYPALPPLHETQEDLCRSGMNFFLCRVSNSANDADDDTGLGDGDERRETTVETIRESVGEAAGAIACHHVPGGIEIDKLFVAEHYARRGVGRTLMEFLLARCPATPMWVSTGAANAPALAFYAAHGFRVIRNYENGDGIALVDLSRPA